MAPPADIPKVPGIGLPPAPPAPAAPSDATAGSRGAPLPVPPAADHADIRPLDIPGGLQILIAEVRAGLEEALLQATAPAAPDEPAPVPTPALPGAVPPFAPGTPPGIAAEVQQLAELLLHALPPASADEAAPAGAALPGGVNPPPTAAPDAARQMVDLLLRSLPVETADDAVLAQRLPVLDLAVQSASARALDIIAAWRDVPPATQAAATLATQWLMNAVSDEPLLAVWLRPEWAGFLPRLENFRRRRRRLRRRLVDPDYPEHGREDGDERR